MGVGVVMGVWGSMGGCGGVGMGCSSSLGDVEKAVVMSKWLLGVDGSLVFRRLLQGWGSSYGCKDGRYSGSCRIGEVVVVL